MKNLAQDDFNTYYITSTEIAKVVGVSRPGVLKARRRGTLPDAISVGGDRIYIWDRQKVQPFINKWKQQRELIEQ